MSDHPIDHERIERAVREILLAIGEDPDRDGLLNTPRRMAKMYEEIFSGCTRTRRSTSPSPSRPTTTRWSWCATSPCTRCASTTWCPSRDGPTWPTSRATDGRITGLSKIARLVDGFAKRPQVQERLTTQIADALMESLQPEGVLVMVEAEHFCMSMRGVKKPGSLTITSAVRGLFKSNAATRAEAMSLITYPGNRL